MPHRSPNVSTTAANIAVEAAKSAPPVAVTVGAVASGLTINHVVGIVTIMYVVMQAGYLLWKWRRDVRRERERKGAGDE